MSNINSAVDKTNDFGLKNQKFKPFPIHNKKVLLTRHSLQE